MRRLFPLAGAALLFLGACPGTQRDLGGTPPPDAEVDPPDAPIDVGALAVPVRVVNWNVRNFYNDVRDSPEVDVADEIILSTLAYETKKNDIVTVLKALAPDIAMLQEVENQIVLDDLASALGDYPHRHITMGNDVRGIDNALLSKHPIDKVVPHQDEFFTSSASGQTYIFARDVLEAHFTINSRHVVLLGIHFKSGTDNESQDKRLAEAERTREIVNQIESQDPTSLVIVLGDFNAVPGSAPLVALEGTSPNQLLSATSGLTPVDRYSVTFGGNPQLFDDQLADPDALAALVGTSVSIEHSSAVDSASDHDPVTATYDVN